MKKEWECEVKWVFYGKDMDILEERAETEMDREAGGSGAAGMVSGHCG